MKRFFILILLLAISLIPAIAQAPDSLLFEVDISPGIDLSIDINVCVEGGISDVFSETLSVGGRVVSDYYYNVSSGYITEAETSNFIETGAKGWIPIQYHLRV